MGGHKRGENKKRKRLVGRSTRNCVQLPSSTSQCIYIYICIKNDNRLATPEKGAWLVAGLFFLLNLTLAKKVKVCAVELLFCVLSNTTTQQWEKGLRVGANISIIIDQ